MTTKSITTKSGKTITVEMIRKVQDVVAYADGLNITTGREIIENTTITLRDETGKIIVTTNSLSKVNQKFDSKAIAAGAVAKLGGIYIRQDVYSAVVGLLAEVESETPKSAEQIAIETAKSNAKIAFATWYNSADQIAHRNLMRDMDSADSDY